MSNHDFLKGNLYFFTQTKKPKKYKSLASITMKMNIRFVHYGDSLKHVELFSTKV